MTKIGTASTKEELLFLLEPFMDDISIDTIEVYYDNKGDVAKLAIKVVNCQPLP